MQNAAVHGPNLPELIQFIQNSRRKFLQLQWPTVEERVDFLGTLREVLLSRQSEWIRLESLETGLSETVLAKMEWQPLSEALAWTTDKAAGKGATLSEGEKSKRPRGLISLICPYGMGLTAALVRLVPALLAGNRVILKLSSRDQVLLKILQEVQTQVPASKDFLFVLGACDPDMKTLLVSHPGIQALSFWGSVYTWSKIRSSVQLHCKVEWFGGGNSVAVVLDESAVTEAAQEIVRSFTAGWGVSPWTCTRVIVVDSVEPALVEALKKAISLETMRAGSEMTWGYPSVWSSESYRSTLKSLREGKAQVWPSTEGDGGAATVSSASELRPLLVRNFSLCSELRFQNLGGPFLLLDTIKYAHEINKKVQPMDRLWSLQLWGESEKVSRLAEKVDCPLILLNRGISSDLLCDFFSGRSNSWNTDGRLSSGHQSLGPEDDLYSMPVGNLKRAEI